MNEACGADGTVNYEGQSAYDVADMVKQYFRDLPEPLFSSKLSETFLQIYQCKKTCIQSANAGLRTTTVRGFDGLLGCELVQNKTDGCLKQL